MKYSKGPTKEKMCSRERVLFVTAFTFLLVVRNGLTIFNPTEGWMLSIREFPNITGFTSSSIGSIIILKLLQVQTSQHLIIVNATIGLTLIFFSLLNFSRLPRRTGVLLGLILTTSPLATHAMSSFGNPDVFLYLGWLMLFSAKRSAAFSVGVVITATAHPYQALLGSLSLYLISIVFPNEKLTRIAKCLIPTCLIVVIIISSWSNLSSHGNTRENLFASYFAQSISNFFSNFPNSLLSYLGPIWLIVALVFLQLNGRKEQVLFLVAFLVLPMIFAISTADGTRVYLGIIFPSALVVIKQFVEKIHNPNSSQINHLIILLALLLYPVTFQITGSMYTPWMGLKSHLQPFVEWWSKLSFVM